MVALPAIDIDGDPRACRSAATSAAPTSHERGPARPSRARGGAVRLACAVPCSSPIRPDGRAWQPRRGRAGGRIVLAFARHLPPERRPRRSIAISRRIVTLTRRPAGHPRIAIDSCKTLGVAWGAGEGRSRCCWLDERSRVRADGRGRLSARGGDLDEVDRLLISRARMSGQGGGDRGRYCPFWIGRDRFSGRNPAARQLHPARGNLMLARTAATGPALLRSRPPPARPRLARASGSTAAWSLRPRPLPAREEGARTAFSPRRVALSLATRWSLVRRVEDGWLCTVTRRNGIDQGSTSAAFGARSVRAAGLPGARWASAWSVHFPPRPRRLPVHDRFRSALASTDYPGDRKRRVLSRRPLCYLWGEGHREGACVRLCPCPSPHPHRWEPAQTTVCRGGTQLRRTSLRRARSRSQSARRARRRGLHAFDVVHPKAPRPVDAWGFASRPSAPPVDDVSRARRTCADGE